MRSGPTSTAWTACEHLVVFPMYTQNGNLDRNFEARASSASCGRTGWPSWSATRYDNPMFVPITFVDFTAGYDTNSAVLFPETVAVREVPRFTWGAIFCDREAARFRAGQRRRRATRCGLQLPPDAARLVDDQALAQSTFVLWDLIHDRTHSHGDLPFDPFMIKQRMPYWMYCAGGAALRPDQRSARPCELEAEGVTPYAATRAVRHRCSTGCSASRSPATGSATTTASAASCCSPTCTSTTCCAGPTTRLPSTGRGSPTP